MESATGNTQKRTGIANKAGTSEMMLPPALKHKGFDYEILDVTYLPFWTSK